MTQSQINRNKTVRFGLTKSKNGVYIDTPEGRYIQDIEGIMKVLCAEKESVRFSYLEYLPDPPRRIK